MVRRVPRVLLLAALALLAARSADGFGFNFGFGDGHQHHAHQHEHEHEHAHEQADLYEGERANGDRDLRSSGANGRRQCWGSRWRPRTRRSSARTAS